MIRAQRQSVVYYRIIGQRNNLVLLLASV